MIARYSRAEMAAVWSDEHRYQIMLEIELLVCEALARRGLVPEEAVAELRSQASVDPARVAEIEAEVHHDVIAFVSAVAESVGPAGRYLHFGMTSSDLLDTTFALQMVEASRLVQSSLGRLMKAVATVANQHRHTVMAGRTHGIHAEPITFGLKLAGWYAELQRAEQRLATALEGISFGKLSGAVGTYAINGPDIEAEVLGELGLAVEPVATQVVPRDRHASYFSCLATMAGSIERFATEIRHMQRTELLEALEPFGKGQKGSSAMPHKRNPILSENLCGLARLVRSNAMAAQENIALWHERDISHSSVERVIGPDATITVDFMLNRMAGLVEGLEVRGENMRRNLDITGGRWASERLLLKLVAQGIERETAYRWVQRCALVDGNFKQAVDEDTDINKNLDKSDIEDAFELNHALGHVDEIMGRVLGG
ncbi:MAG: adenylosuccinate lyase [Deltaproteobacteria bacterium]